MKVTKKLPTTYTVQLELSQQEAKILREVASYNCSIPQMVERTGLDFEEVQSSVLTDLNKALVAMEQA